MSIIRGRTNTHSRSSFYIATLVKIIMIGVVGLFVQRGLLRRPIVVSATERGANLLETFSTSAKFNGKSDTQRHRRIQVQVVHRHGDRTPITPLKDEDYWKQQMIDPVELERIATHTRLVHPEPSENRHGANGRGPFGKLTAVGLGQMVDLGTRLRETLSGSNQPVSDPLGRTLHPHIWTADRPLKPSNIRVISTNFLRTIQSVQGVLTGLFPDGTNSDEKIDIDIRHTNWIIPDPQPRHTKEQEELEKELSVRPHITHKEKELLPLAIRATEALHDSLAEDAREADFGVPQQANEDAAAHGTIQPLSWNQLAEITKCLAVRNLLPPGITKENQEDISRHAAWRWYESFRHPRLVHLSMGRLAGAVVDSFVQHKREPPMTLWSAHDSTLIGLMCAFRLEQPAVWPEYASYLMMELIQVDEGDVFVRFSLNGSTLKSQWDKDEPTEMIALSALVAKLRSSQGTSGVHAQ
jgi:Histidine phosphatase superfamily (branch 2)